MALILIILFNCEYILEIQIGAKSPTKARASHGRSRNAEMFSNSGDCQLISSDAPVVWITQRLTSGVFLSMCSYLNSDLGNWLQHNDTRIKRCYWGIHVTCTKVWCAYDSERLEAGRYQDILN
mmetsp:Transcript_9772/g.17892  ORF Transcript_9772/g.17892 Transcript_9772/m.17892 type:complete len:123 (-) Transcript_9772:79-447(-)